VALAPPHTVLKTSSGKIRRAACRELYEQGKIGTPPAAIWWQVIRLLAAGVLPQVRRGKQVAVNVGYTVYAWSLFGVLGLVAWGMIMLLPQRSWRQAVVRTLMRLGLRLAGIPLLIRGLERLPQHLPYVLVANHASYLDALVLQAVFVSDIRYVAKQELAGHWLMHLPLQRLGVEFVERFDVQRGVEDTARVLKAVQEGHSVMFFPEGTFGREPGLRPFRLGAFVVAAQTGVPVVPLVLRGTRSILRAQQWLLRRGTVQVVIHPPVAPTGTDWAAALMLRDVVREQILRECGEPDLGAETPPLLRRTPRET
jgi:1-acyl-sn-glycerol-3-phosphate acyltransferase